MPPAKCITQAAQPSPFHPGLHMNAAFTYAKFMQFDEISVVPFAAVRILDARSKVRRALWLS